MTAPRLDPGHPDTGLPDLVQALASDVKHLAANEIRLAKIELAESVREGARGGLWLGVALAIGVITAIALTVALVAAVAAVANGNVWLGALIVGAVEVAAAAWLVKRGMARFGARDEDTT